MRGEITGRHSRPLYRHTKLASWRVLELSLLVLEALRSIVCTTRVLKSSFRSNAVPFWRNAIGLLAENDFSKIEDRY
jgi:hypothetical protein